MDCDAIEAALRDFKLIQDCGPVSAEWTRISTVFQLHDGSYVDLFASQREDGSVVLSDLGNTAAWLLDAQVEWWSTPPRKQIVEDTCRALGVEETRGEFRVTLETMDGFGDGIIRLAQACLRIADLMFTRPTRAQRIFHDEVESLIASLGRPYTANIAIKGKHRDKVSVDFLVSGLHHQNYVNTLSAERAGNAKQQVDALVAKLYDLKSAPDRKPAERFVSVFDDRKQYKDRDLHLVADLSDVLFPWSAPGAIADYLKQ